MSRARLMLLVALLVAAVGILLAVGLLLLVILGAAGAAVAVVWLAVNRVRRMLGREPAVTVRTTGYWKNTRTVVHRVNRMGLDPSLEIGMIEADLPLRSPPDSDPRPSPDTAPDRQP